MTTKTKNAVVWLYQPANDETVDPEYELRTAAYADTGVGVQDGRTYGGGFTVREYGVDKDGAQTVRFFAEHRTLAAAKRAAEKLYRERA